MMQNRMNQTNTNRGNRYVSSISWRLFGALIVFVSMILLVIWVFQIVLLNQFYEKAKTEELIVTDREISSSFHDENTLCETVYVRSVETQTCIRVYKIANGETEIIADSDVNMGCSLHHIGDGLNRYYHMAVENGGTYTHTRKDNESNSHSTFMVTVKQTDDGVAYVIMQDVELQPLDVTVTTLQRQFGWIMCILVMGAMVMALVLSRMICMPMQRMGQSAKRLAKGDYGAHFVGGGYREAEELAEALNYAASELQKTDVLQRELVANISHDLRTPLTMIKGYSEMMRDIPDENTPENVQVIIDETERLTELVNDVLDLSKIKAGTRKPDMEVFDLTETVAAVLTRYEKLTDQKYVINFNADQNVCIKADRTMILQVMYNLINNALNYTGEDKTVTIVQTVAGGRVRISVTDTGEGIADEDIPYIWDRYYKVDKVHKRAVVGTGLGLSIVKGILESHRAIYGVESTLGVGSTFYFELDAIYDGSFEEYNGDVREK